MTLNDKMGFFLAISSCDTSLYHSQGGATQLSRYAIQMEFLVFVY